MAGCENCPALHTTIFQKIWLSPIGIGGSERGVDRQSRGLAKIGVPTDIFTCGDYYRGKPRPDNFSPPNLDATNSGVSVHEIPTVEEIVDIVSSLSPSRIGILQMVWGFEHYPEALKKCLHIPNTPKVFNTMEIHQFDQITQELGSKQDKEKHLEQMRANIDCLVAISRPLVDEATCIGFPHVKKIYIPVPTEVFTPANPTQKISLREKYNLPPDKKICFFAGRIVEEKGVNLIINSWEKISQSSDNSWHLLIAGGIKPDSPIARKFEEFIKRPNVTYAGVVSEEIIMADMMRLSDTFLYPTTHMEGLGLSVAEAMACGLPIITTTFAAEKTGMSDLVVPDQTGKTFDHTSNPLGIAHILSNVSTSELESIGKRTREHIFQLGMDCESVSLQWKQLYCELLSQKQRCPRKQ